jgi:hypothetical protein
MDGAARAAQQGQSRDPTQEPHREIQQDEARTRLFRKSHFSS